MYFASFRFVAFRLVFSFLRSIAISVSVYACLYMYMSHRLHISKITVQTSRNVLYVLSVAVVGPALTTVQYVMYFRFCGWRHICP